MYAKTMAINDNLIIQYYTLATNVPMEKVEKIENELKKGSNPMQIKKGLAFEIVRELHSEKDAETAQDNFERTVQKGERPTEIEEVKFKKGQTIEELLVEKNIIESKSQVKRLGEQGGLTIDEEKVKSNNPAVDGILKIGKNRHFKLIQA
jgi:tyrosyl-tRNA synthetase